MKEYPDLASSRFLIDSVFKNFHSEERIQKDADPYAGFNGCVWTEAVSGRRSCGFKKYPDACGRIVDV